MDGTTMQPESEAADASAGARKASAPVGRIQSVDRAMLILETIAASPQQAALGDIASAAGLNVSTCHHLLATLVDRGYVAKVPGRGAYVLGSRILQLSQACLRQVDLPRRAEPFLDGVNRATGETVHLGVLQGDTVVTLLKRQARHAIRIDTGGLGTSDAPHATATGKAMLAWLPEDQVRRIVGVRGMTRFTPHTTTEMPALLEELRLVRRNGYAEDREEFQLGVQCVGAAIRDHQGGVVGAFSASAPSNRADADHLARMREEVVGAARALSVELGQPAGA